MAYLLSILPLLACPLGMGLMMWMMSRGNKSQSMGGMQMPAQNTPDGQASANLSPDERLAELRAQLSAVQEEQESIAAQMRHLSGEDWSAEPHGAPDAATRASR
jgi:2,4-dienoyl-CoA reductase-like NADH-dependent reductase (Old Yellow Enzyme family)